MSILIHLYRIKTVPVIVFLVSCILKLFGKECGYSVCINFFNGFGSGRYLLIISQSSISRAVDAQDFISESGHLPSLGLPHSVFIRRGKSNRQRFSGSEVVRAVSGQAGTDASQGCYIIAHMLCCAELAFSTAGFSRTIGNSPFPVKFLCL